MQVVAYDADSGMYAARLWWMLRFMGHDAVAVLDGGLARWQRDGHAVRGGVETSTPAHLRGAPRPGWRLTVDEVAAGLGNPARLLVDARSNERYRGMNETLDKVAGHIPGAANYFFQQNLTDDKTFKSPEELQGPVGAGAEGPRPEGRGGLLRVRRDRLPQPAGPGARRHPRREDFPGILERMVRRPVPAGRNRANLLRAVPVQSPREPFHEEI